MQVSSTANTFDNSNCVVIYSDWVCSFCLLVEQVLSEAVFSEHNLRKLHFYQKSEIHLHPTLGWR